MYGENAGTMLSERVDAACDYLSKNDGAVCILSGGKGDDEDIVSAPVILCKRAVRNTVRIYILKTAPQSKNELTVNNDLFKKLCGVYFVINTYPKFP